MMMMTTMTMLVLPRMLIMMRVLVKIVRATTSITLLVKLSVGVHKPMSVTRYDYFILDFGMTECSSCNYNKNNK